jgi:hypothetical protein
LGELDPTLRRKVADVTASEDSAASGDRRIKRSTYISEDLVERAKAAVFWTRVIQGEPNSYADLTERALRAEVERLERLYNEGEPFEIPEGEGLRPGPAPGVMKRVAELRRAAREAPQKGAGDG